jgi:hypothetical protein
MIMNAERHIRTCSLTLVQAKTAGSFKTSDVALV